MSRNVGSEILILAVMVALGATPLAAGSPDCNGNGWPDSSDISHGVSQDCNENEIPDECDIAAGTSQDCEPDGVPDECGVDCNGNGLSDSCDIASGPSQDCNGNGVPDECDAGIRLEPRLVTPWTVSSGAGDVDNDGDLDIVAGHGGGTRVWENEGGGVFNSFEMVASNLGYVGLGDLDDDGYLDVLISDWTNLYWHRNLDGGGWGGATQITPPGLENAWPLPVAVVDLDGDTDLDIVHLFNWAVVQDPPPHQVVWYEKLDGQATYSAPHVIYEGEAAPWFVETADVDGDGDSDILCGHIGEMVWYENDGGGSFTRHHVDDGSVPSLVGDDIDGDGDTDLLAAVSRGAGYELSWYRNLDGDGQFGSAEPIDGGDLGVTLADLIDFDRDGDVDAVVHTGLAEDLRWYENLDGRGTFGPAIFLWSTLDSNPHELPIAVDIDGDVDLDLMTDGQTWLENASGDCDGNGVPDSCEADCNASGIVDACDISGGISVDCDANLVPDECDVACAGCNADEDVCVDELDCAPGDDTVWADPGFVTNLRLQGDGPTQLSWQAPASPGADSVRYDTLRSDSPGDFFLGTTCLDSDGADTVSEDGDTLAPGELFYYLIRVENDCPGSGGSMGAASDGTPRVGIVCF